MPVSSVAKDVGTILSGLGLGVVGTSLFEGVMPATPTNATTIYDMQGRKPVRTGAKTVAVEYPNLSILIRDADYETGADRANTIRKSLQTWSGVVNGTTYLDVTATSTVFSLGRDENGAFMFSINFTATKVPR